MVAGGYPALPILDLAGWAQHSKDRSSLPPAFHPVLTPINYPYWATHSPQWVAPLLFVFGV